MKTDTAVTPQDRSRLEGLVGHRNTSAKIVWRAQIVLASAVGESVILQEQEAGRQADEVCRKHGICKATFFR